MAKADVNYSAMANERNPFIQPGSADEENLNDDSDVATDTDNEEPPHHSGLMIHIVPDTSKC